MYWINGVQGETVSASDRSFNYGDGGFTTIKTFDGQPLFWSLHVERMQTCLQLLHIIEPDWNQVRAWVNQAAIEQGLGGLKLHVSRGCGGRGYSPVGVTESIVTISEFGYPTHYKDWQRDGVELGVAELKLGINPLLAGHKHNNRLEQVLLKADVEQQGFQDGVVLDLNEHVVETTMANLFWIQGKTLYTPSMEKCGVSGVIRRLVIQEAQKSGMKVLLGEFDIAHLMSADEIFMCNSLLGVAPVVKITHKSYPVGIITRDFQESINSA
ncbi:aminodeoxychorismate lyase [Vibrio inusitatus NBRC 102082]|uniref:Aminodeoxychorismate lyase n=1 Tax=Vibrio inusitatus NBRC 102082 TaxID=1219070 RepID=A0A4Y3HTC4_9VIBR|nr:aminodeoxychorismate lyase [Vibrio inusitatus]GEA49554.1 aminodeoxychorismate lyase [Vibrio inusitatus NBRC 102082]